MNHFLLHMLAERVKPSLRGRRVGAIRTLPPVLTVEFAGGADPRYAVVILSSPGPFLYFDRTDPIAGLGTEIMRRVRDFAVVRVEVPANDRIVRFELSAPREPVVLSVCLFGSRAKVRVEGRATVIESLDPGETGEAVPPERLLKGMGFAAIGEEELARVLGSLEPAETQVPGLSRELLDCFTRPGGVDHRELIAFRDGVLEGRERFVLGTRRRMGYASPLPVVGPGAHDARGLSAAAAPPLQEPTLYGPFENAEDACRDVGLSILNSLRDEIVDRSTAALRKHVASRRRLLAGLEEQLREAESSKALRNEANTLASYQSRIVTGEASVTLPNLYGPGDVTIRLDPAVPLQEQIKKRFKRAAKLERSRTRVEKRIGTVAEEIDRLERELEHAKKQPSFGDAVRLIEAAARRSDLRTAASKRKRSEPQTRQLRRFDLDEQWFVLVGRSDRENDEITFRIASPDDIWFHAQHVPGSHVVLKSRGTPGNPPPPILEAAARVAAHYSKARRASVVPVIYTRRKYVRKFKGSKPGQVVCEREKTILAEPGLPESAEE